MAGTAPRATTWIAWEYAGPWGRKALESERLDPMVREGLVALSRSPGITVVLVRRPPSFTTITEPVVIVAHAATVRPHGFIAPQPDARALGDWDALALVTGNLPNLADRQEIDAPMLLVCTHSSRDTCCAIEGRHLLTSLREEGVAAWESSHLGGHRFAPTALVLPDGAVYGRLDRASAGSLVTDGVVDLVHARGMSASSPAEQVAELELRREIGEHRRGVITAAEGHEGRVVVTHSDGRAWQLTIESSVGHVARPESCGGEFHLPTSLRCTGITAL